MDCVEYMRTLPDNHFDIAICDPPYGDADSGNFYLGAFWRFVRPLQATDCDSTEATDGIATSSHKLPPPSTTSRLESTHKAELGRQNTEDRQSRLRRQTQPIFISEYWIPEDRFVCIAEIKRKETFSASNNSKKVTERIFVPKHQQTNLKKQLNLF